MECLPRALHVTRRSLHETEPRTSPSRLDLKQLSAEQPKVMIAPIAPRILPGGPWLSHGGPGREAQAVPSTSLPSPLNLKHCVDFQNTVERLDSTRLRKASVCRHTQWLRNFGDAGEMLSWPGSDRLFLS